MPYDPLLPATLAPTSSAVLREQFHGIVDLIGTIPVGPAGPAGITAVAVDGVTTELPGASATAAVTLTGQTLHFSFSIPRGDVGLTGSTGGDGGTGPVGPTGPPLSSYIVDSTNTLPAGMPASVAATFDGVNLHFIFGIPTGADGAPGPVGATGPSDLSGTSNNSNGVAVLAGPLADPDAEALRQKMNELILALRR